MRMFDKKEPYEVAVKAGKNVYLCQCGNTATAPFCDGSHNRGGNKQPYEHKAVKDGNIYVCGCGKTKTAPFCDGSHNT